MRSVWLMTALAVSALSAGSAMAADKTVKSKPTHKIIKSSDSGLLHEEKYAVGFQSTWPAWGLSGQMDISDKLTGQLTIGTDGDANVYSLRGLFNLKKSSTPYKHNYYGFVALGDESYPSIDSFGNTSRESTFIYGFGAGVEAAPFKKTPVWLSFEVGLSFATFKNYSSSYGDGLNMGIGAHYRF